MPFRKLTKTKGCQLAGLVIVALSLYLIPNLCLAACPMAVQQKCFCDHESSSSSPDEITASNCCSIKQAPAKDEAMVSAKPVQVSSLVVPFHTITLSGLSSQIFATSELPTPVARLTLQKSILRI